MANTNTPEQEESAEPQGIPGLDAITEPTGRTQADARSAEDLLVQKLLGVDLRAVGMNRPLDIANRIVQRVSSILIDTRQQVEALATTGAGPGALEQAITERWTPEMNRNARLRTRAIADAVRATFPAEVTRELVERLWPTVYRMDAEDYFFETKPSDLVLVGVQLEGSPSQKKRQFRTPQQPPNRYKLIVDTDHPFWKSPGTERKDLVKRIAGRSPQECGIRTVPDRFGKGTTLTEGDAKNILRHLSTNVYMLDTATEDPVINNVNGYRVRLKLRQLIAEMSRLALDASQPPQVQNALNSEAGLATFLGFSDNFLGDCWSRFVDVVPNGLTTVGPAPTPAVSHVNDELAARAFQMISRHPVVGLGGGRMRLKDIARHQHALHRFSDILRKGDVNPWDVATAMTMVQQRGELADLMTAQDNKEAIQKTGNRLQLLQYMNQLRSLSEPGNIPYIPRAPSGIPLARVRAESGRIANDIGRLAVGYTTTTSLVPRSLATARNIDSIRSALMDAQEAASKAENALNRAGQILEGTYNILQGDSDVSIAAFTLLTPLINPGPPPTAQPTALTLSTNFQAVADQIQQEFPNLRDEKEYRDELKKLQEKASKAPTGKGAIHAIYMNFFKGRGLSEREALKAANYLMARNAIDGQGEEIVQSAVRAPWGVERDDALFGEAREGSTWMERFGFQMRGLGFNPVQLPGINLIPGLRGADRRANDIMHTLAASCGIPQGAAAGRVPNYEAANYEPLARYYYALKSLMGGTGVMRLPKYYSVPQEELRTVGAILARRHTRALLTMFKGQLPGDYDQEDKPVETILGQPEKLRVILADILDGDPPDTLKPSIEQALNRAGQKFEFWRRAFITNRLVGDKWSLKQAALSTANPLSVRNALFGRYGIGTMGWGATKAAGRAVAATPKAVWGERKRIALGAILGTLFLPGVGTMIGAGAGGLWRKVMKD